MIYVRFLIQSIFVRGVKIYKNIPIPATHPPIKCKFGLFSFSQFRCPCGYEFAVSSNENIEEKPSLACPDVCISWKSRRPHLHSAHNFQARAERSENMQIYIMVSIWYTSSWWFHITSYGKSETLVLFHSLRKPGLLKCHSGSNDLFCRYLLIWDDVCTWYFNMCV